MTELEQLLADLVDLASVERVRDVLVATARAFLL
jgi:hypothetical protein